MVEREIWKDSELVRVDRCEGINGHFGKQERIFRARTHRGPNVVVKCHHATGLEELERQNGIAEDIGRLVTGIDADDYRTIFKLAKYF